MDSTAIIPGIQGATLAEITYSWQGASAELVLHADIAPRCEQLKLRFGGVSRLVVPRQCGKLNEPAVVRRVAGPILLDDKSKVSYLRIETTSGDLLELDFDPLEIVGPSLVRISTTAPRDQGWLPHLHDASLVEVCVREEDRTAEMLVGR